MQNIDTIIWDLDNTLYKFNDSQIDGWNTATVQYALANGVDIDKDKAMELALDGFRSHRNSAHHFQHKFGLDSRKMHIGVNLALCETMTTPCDETPDLMSDLPHLRHVILTYAIRDWATRVLAHTNLSQFFDADLILGADDYNFEDKADSALGILTALKASKATPSNTLFVEDTLPNLKPAKEQAGVQTVYLHHDRPTKDLDTSFVDIIVRDTPELLRMMSTNK